MNPGLLNRPIQLQRQAPGLFLVTASGEFLEDSDGNRLTTNSRQDDLGQEVDAWGLWKERRARRMDARGRMVEANDREHSEATLIYRIRYDHGTVLQLTTADRLVDRIEKLAYEIVDWMEPERMPARRYLDITVVRRRNPQSENQTV